MYDVSVIVPVYNMAKDGILEYCMLSLVRQTLKSLEIIAVDDASTDDSLEVLRRFEKEYPGRVKVIASPKNQRQGGAKNLGLEVAGGRFITFVDADDWISEELYERMLAVAEQTGADVVGTDMCRVYEQTMTPTQTEECNLDSQVGVMDHEKRKEFLLHPGPLVAKLFAHEIFCEPALRFPTEMSYEDNALFVEIAMRLKHFERVPGPNYFYYQHGASTTHHVDLKKVEDRMEAMRIMMRYAKENGALEEFGDVIEFHFANMFYRNTLLTYMQGDIKKKVSFVESMGREMLETFPEFRKNAYYLREVNEYERKLIDLQLASTRKFFFIYRLKRISKFFKDRLKGNGAR
ncbi:MAG: glycosyltransferase family 2 protein [Lachnospiraceae bacterium]|nr:glycosyltransferase family 2 protein [Lachnospiraceae bacterium]